MSAPDEAHSIHAVASSPPDHVADPATRVVAVLDMGASAIRLAIAELTPNARPRIIEEASRGVLLGRDTFSLGAIRSQTIDATITALAGFLQIMKEYGVDQVHAVAT